MGFQVTTTTVYLLLIEITVLFGAVMAWLIHRSSCSPRTGKHEPNLTLHELEDQPLVPWGWPNHQSKSNRRVHKPDGDEAMHALMECIMMEKRLITEGDLQVEHDVLTGSDLNSPANDESIDIVDVFGRSRNVLKHSLQGRVASRQAVFRKNETDLNFRQFEKKEILQPWGW